MEPEAVSIEVIFNYRTVDCHSKSRPEGNPGVSPGITFHSNQFYVAGVGSVLEFCMANFMQQPFIEERIVGNIIHAPFTW